MQAVAKSQKIKKSTSTKVFYVICYTFVALMALVCLLPFIMVVSGSFSSEQAIRFQGYGILPREFTTAAYALIFKSPMTVVRAYGVSIFITLAGTAVGLLLTTMTAYVISRKDFKYRNALSFFFYFTTLFNGGMVCSYIFYIQYLHLKDSYLALILPGVFNVFYLLIMRTFVSAIPTALIESAKIDGAGEFKTFFSIILPLLKSGMATIGLFLALGYWNDWYNAMLYMNTENAGNVPDGKLCKHSAAGYAIQLPEAGHGSCGNRPDHSGLPVYTEIFCKRCYNRFRQRLMERLDKGNEKGGKRNAKQKIKKSTCCIHGNRHDRRPACRLRKQQFQLFQWWSCKERIYIIRKR